MEQKPQLKLITKQDFEQVKSKYTDIKPAAKTIIDQATEPLDILALSVQEGSGFTVLSAKIMNEEREDDFLELFKEGTV